ncbi:MAG: hypothetical protein AAF614_17590, partial [Chloroflexota bacterium]
MSPKQEDLTYLRQKIIRHFSSSELQDLCFDLGIDYESLDGVAKKDKVRELISYAIRRNQLQVLIE